MVSCVWTENGNLVSNLQNNVMSSMRILRLHKSLTFIFDLHDKTYCADIVLALLLSLVLEQDRVIVFTVRQVTSKNEIRLEGEK